MNTTFSYILITKLPPHLAELWYAQKEMSCYRNPNTVKPENVGLMGFNPWPRKKQPNTRP